MKRIGEVSLATGKDVRQIQDQRHFDQLGGLERNVEENDPPSGTHVSGADAGHKGEERQHDRGQDDERKHAANHGERDHRRDDHRHHPGDHPQPVTQHKAQRFTVELFRAIPRRRPQNAQAEGHQHKEDDHHDRVDTVPASINLFREEASYRHLPTVFSAWRDSRLQRVLPESTTAAPLCSPAIREAQSDDESVPCETRAFPST